VGVSQFGIGTKSTTKWRGPTSTAGNCHGKKVSSDIEGFFAPIEVTGPEVASQKHQIYFHSRSTLSSFIFRDLVSKIREGFVYKSLNNDGDAFLANPEPPKLRALPGSQERATSPLRALYFDTLYGRIISLSSWFRTWQCHT
jgi:hypothetical protein